MKPFESMTEDEKTWFRSQLSLAARETGGPVRYLEYGMGFSTLWALETPAIESIRAVDGNKGYIENWALQIGDIRDAVAGNRLRIAHADTLDAHLRTPPDPKWGERGRYYSLFAPSAPYSSEPTEGENEDWFTRGHGSFDVALVDGRFRLACILACAFWGVERILVHDWIRRPHYHAALKYTEVVDTRDTFVRLQPLPGISPDIEALQLLDEAVCDPR